MASNTLGDPTCVCFCAVDMENDTLGDPSELRPGGIAHREADKPGAAFKTWSIDGIVFVPETSSTGVVGRSGLGLVDWEGGSGRNFVESKTGLLWASTEGATFVDVKLFERVSAVVRITGERRKGL